LAERAFAKDLQTWRAQIRAVRPFRLLGRVTKVIGLTVEVEGLNTFIGEICAVHVPGEPRPRQGEVVGFRGPTSLLMPLGELRGIRPGCRVEPLGRALTVRVGEHLLGRVVDGLGRPLHGGEGGQPGQEPPEAVEYPVHNTPPDPLDRRRIDQVLATGVRAIDGFLTCGRGQRLGVFSGSGVGKSVLLGMLCRHCTADVNVVALVGERGREVKDFLERDLGPEGLARSVVVVATSDQPALIRLRAALVATTIAEYFRDQGRDVLLLMDSVTRFALAQREVGLAVGEPPTTRGYTPSVFALLPKLLERAGTNATGSITGFYTVLVEGDDLQEPVADAVRSILDGHIVLSRELAARNHYPAIDVLQSASRLMPDLASPEHQRAAAYLRRLLAAFKEAEDLVNIGAYVSGSNPLVDEALAKYGSITGFLQQEQDEHTDFGETVTRLRTLAGEAEGSDG
jgi:flagellum-specific ATP synthase/type III secretion protein N (ATPase)